MSARVEIHKGDSGSVAPTSGVEQNSRTSLRCEDAMRIL